MRCIRFIRAFRIALFGVPVKPHRHEWETIAEVELTDVWSNATGRRFTLRCKGCGEIEKRDLI